MIPLGTSFQALLSGGFKKHIYIHFFQVYNGIVAKTCLFLNKNPIPYLLEIY